MVIALDKYTLEKTLCVPLQTNTKQSEIAVAFPTGCNGIFNVTTKSNKFYVPSSNTNKDGLVQITVPPSA